MEYAIKDSKKLLSEIDKLEELKILLKHKMISFKEYLSFFNVTFSTRGA